MRIARVVKSIAAILFGAVAISAVGAYWFFSRLPDLCGNEVLAETQSPDGTLRAVVFERDCGATTGFATHVAVIGARDKLDASTASIFSADTNRGAAPAGPGGGPEVTVQWSSPASLVVSHHPAARIFRQEGKSGRVVIQYALGVKSAG